jgi:hypothetical protein
MRLRGRSGAILGAESIHSAVGARHTTDPVCFRHLDRVYAGRPTPVLRGHAAFRRETSVNGAGERRDVPMDGYSTTAGLMGTWATARDIVLRSNGDMKLVA